MVVLIISSFYFNLTHPLALKISILLFLLLLKRYLTFSLLSHNTFFPMEIFYTLPLVSILILDQIFCLLTIFRLRSIRNTKLVGISCQNLNIFYPPFLMYLKFS